VTARRGEPAFRIGRGARPAARGATAAGLEDRLRPYRSPSASGVEGCRGGESPRSWETGEQPGDYKRMECQPPRAGPSPGRIVTKLLDLKRLVTTLPARSRKAVPKGD